MKRASNKVDYTPTFLGTCNICKGRGRLIDRKELGQQYLCYECYHKCDIKSDPVTVSKSDYDYQLALQTYYLKPLYYGEKPNMEAIQKAHDDLIGLKITKIHPENPWEQK